MNARLLYLTLVSEMSIRPNGVPAKLTHAAPLSALPAFFMPSTDSMQNIVLRPVHFSPCCRPPRLAC